MQSAGSRQNVACAGRRVSFSAKTMPSLISRPLERLQDGLRVIRSVFESSQGVHKPVVWQVAYLLFSLTINAGS